LSAKCGKNNEIGLGTGRREIPRFEVVTLSLPGSCDPGAPIAASRSGALGVLDLTHVSDVVRARSALERMSRLSSGATGVLLERSRGEFVRRALEGVGAIDTVILDPAGDSSDVSCDSFRGLSRRTGLVVRRETDLRGVRTRGVDFIVAKGHEAGGRIGEETSFVLLQRLLSSQSLPVYAWGGIGPNTAVSCHVAGAAGVVLDWQLSLMRESMVPARLRRLLEEMDGSETHSISTRPGEYFRFARDPAHHGSPERTFLLEEGHWAQELERAYVDPGTTVFTRWPISQDASFARRWAREAGSVGRAVRALKSRVVETTVRVRGCKALGEGAPLARSHGTRYPLVQGPMTRVSDVPAFALAVSKDGGLPFLALALMGKDEATKLLKETGAMMRGLPWGVGILGFVDKKTRDQQIEAIREVLPPFAVIAGGRPDQAKALEELGIATYLHVPSPAMLHTFLLEGARRFVFEGRECGGHVGPRTSFVLWEQMLDTLLSVPLPPEERTKLHVLFAGGIHDGLSAAMVAGMAQPLVDAGAKVGVQLGTAYLFTEEIVATGALSPCFQDVARETRGTALVETGPGHAIRCAETDYVREFAAEKERLQRDQVGPETVRETLERMNLGRLRVASKGIKRDRTELVTVVSEEQRRDGMFMVGQVAALRTSKTTIAELHRHVCDGAVEQLELSANEPAEVSIETGAPAPFDIAIVGLGCLLPGAQDPEEFWQNVIEGRDSVTEIPPDRFDYSRWFDPDPKAKDRIYSKWGGFLSDVSFDPLEFGVPPAAIPSIEPMQLLALVLVQRALKDAGYARDNPHREQTAVILGAGGGLADLGARYTTRAMIPGLIENPDDSLYGQLPEWTEDSFAGILLNVISGRVSNRFDLGGVNFTVDAACASSLAAVYLGCRELATGTSDMVIAGGCDTVQNPLSYLCFSKTSALSPTGRSKAFDSSADGIVISEGLAAVVLKRREDAERDGDRIYAVIRAVAGGSDGRQRSLTAPSVEGQERTLARAYRQAGFDISSVGLIEAHGTGTSLGDPTECQALGRALTRAGSPRASVAIGSVKSMIGHTKATAGIAGLVKAALALHHRALPPTLHVEQPNPKAELESGPLYVNTRLRPWIRRNDPRRAAVSAFGFGGTNFHAVLEEYEGEASERRFDSPRRAREVELFVFQSLTNDGLRESVRDLGRDVRREREERRGDLDLAELAISFHRRQRRSGSETCRAALVAADVEDLLARIDWLEGALAVDEAARGEAPRGVYFAGRPFGPETGLAFLFPGQGSQYVDMLSELAVEFAEVRESLERAEKALASEQGRPLTSYIFPAPVFRDEERRRLTEELKATQVAQPALGACGVAMLRLLESFGLRPSVAGGHSYGELVALFAAGAFDEETLYRLSRDRGEAMAARPAGEPGGMLAVSADGDSVRAALAGIDEIWIANLNSPRQTIVSGTAAGLERAAGKLAAVGTSAIPIPVACAFHSPLVAHARERFALALANARIERLALPVYNNSTAAPYQGDPGNVRALLADNLVQQVRFQDEILAMYRDGVRVFVEVGPGGVLTKLVGQILGNDPHLAIATDPRNGAATTALAHALAALAAQGIPVALDRLYEGRGLEAAGSDSVSDSTPGRPASSRHRHLWLVNGAYSRPASSPARSLVPRSRLSGAEPARALSALPESIEVGAPYGTDGTVDALVLGEVGGGTPTGRDEEPAREALAEFQRTMRSFLETQELVMRAYFGEGAPEVELSETRSGEDSLALPDRGHQNVRPLPHDSPETPRRELSVEPSPAHRPDPHPDRDLESTLLAIVSERTGYPKEMLKRDSDLEADLGIDSIKRVEIIATCRRRVAPELSEAPRWFMEEMTGARSLGAILKGLQELVESGGTGTGAAAAPTLEAVSAPTNGGARKSTARLDPPPIDSLLLSVVAERTGYPTETLEWSSNLEADLGIDSIKRVEIIAASRRKALPGLEAPPAWFMEEMTEARTLDAIRTGLAKLVAAHGGGGAHPSIAGEPDALSSDAEGGERDCPRCVPEPVEEPLVSSAAFRSTEGVFVITDDESDVAPKLQSRIESAGGRARIVGRSHLESREAAERAVEQIRQNEGPIGGVVHLRGLSAAPGFPGIDEAAWNERVSSELKSLLFLLQAVAPELTASRAGERVVLSASIGGGDFGSDPEECSRPWRGGLAGLLKTAQKEWPGATFRALDFDTAPGADLLVDELGAAGEVEIGYRNGKRLGMRAVRREIDPALEAAPFREGSVVLVTGGARGITARVVRDLATSVRATFLLLGRSPEPREAEHPSTVGIPDAIGLRAHLAASTRATGATPKPREIEKIVAGLLAAREIRETLAAIRATGSDAVYRSCDVRDGDSLDRVRRELEGSYGPVNVLIHGAGIIEDKNIVDKTGESFDRVLDTKLAPVLHFAAHLDARRLERVVLFSSVAGFYGNPGQGDYAASNEILNRLARRLRHVWEAEIVSINWGPWDGVGMVSPEVARQFASRGVGMVPVEAGCAATRSEMALSGREDVRVLVGPGPWVREEEAPSPSKAGAAHAPTAREAEADHLMPASITPSSRRNS
jgi:acyl transferase domain-containing protein/NAD(P)H-dependent flavin oxidoreductase YrpB (nitropropane dioxygenase family)/NAD(P)-dependent dehydrogenase (short-subunit alcohol dehydrogenase family)/acyl carrier protein